MIAERRGRWDPALEIVGYGRAAFILVANCNPYTYAGSLPLQVVPGARLELGLDFVAPERVRARSVPRMLAYIVTGKGQLTAGDVLLGPRPRPDRGALRPAAAAAGRRRGPRRRRARRVRGGARRRLRSRLGSGQVPSPRWRR